MLNFLIAANLLPNLVVEFYFLVQLLTAKGRAVEGANLLLAEGKLQNEPTIRRIASLRVLTFVDTQNIAVIVLRLLPNLVVGFYFLVQLLIAKGGGVEGADLLLAEGISQMSRVLRKPAFCICENKDADQLRGNGVADQRLCLRYTDSTISLLPKSEISHL